MRDVFWPAPLGGGPVSRRLSVRWSGMSTLPYRAPSSAMAGSRYWDGPVVESACECGVASFTSLFNGHLQRAMLADQDDGVFSPRDRGVEQAPLKYQGASGGAQGDDDPGILAALGAVDGDRVGVEKLVEFIVVILSPSSVRISMRCSSWIRPVIVADEVRAATRAEIKAGADFIKAMATGGVLTAGVDPGHTRLVQEELAVAAQEAHNAGRRITSATTGPRTPCARASSRSNSPSRGTYLARPCSRWRRS